MDWVQGDCCLMGYTPTDLFPLTAGRIKHLGFRPRLEPNSMFTDSSARSLYDTFTRSSRRAYMCGVRMPCTHNRRDETVELHSFAGVDVMNFKTWKPSAGIEKHKVQLAICNCPTPYDELDEEGNPVWSNEVLR